MPTTWRHRPFKPLVEPSHGLAKRITRTLVITLTLSALYLLIFSLVVYRSALG